MRHQGWKHAVGKWQVLKQDQTSKICSEKYQVLKHRLFVSLSAVGSLSSAQGSEALLAVHTSEICVSWPLVDIDLKGYSWDDSIAFIFSFNPE